MVSSMGYVVLSGKMHVERQETHFFTCSDGLTQQAHSEHTYLILIAALEYRVVDLKVLTLCIKVPVCVWGIYRLITVLVCVWGYL